MQFIIPLCKIDEEKRLVVGRVVQEVRDRSGEILDYATAVPAFKEWSDDFVRATQGLSKGNVRVMHNPKIVAGKVVDIVFDDNERAIDVCCKIVDDQEWKKVVEGVYTGFSVGGSYAKKWQDGETTRYTPKVSEISLVDRPCIPTCTIAELHKADGTVEELVLKGRDSSLEDMVQEAANKAVGAALAKRVPPRTYIELGKFDESKHPRDDDGKFTEKASKDSNVKADSSKPYTQHDLDSGRPMPQKVRGYRTITLVNNPQNQKYAYVRSQDIEAETYINKVVDSAKSSNEAAAEIAFSMSGRRAFLIAANADGTVRFFREGYRKDGDWHFNEIHGGDSTVRVDNPPVVTKSISVGEMEKIFRLNPGAMAMMSKYLPPRTYGQLVPPRTYGQI